MNSMWKVFHLREYAYGKTAGICVTMQTLPPPWRVGVMSFNHNEQKPKKFFGFEVGDSVTYIIVAILLIIFIRQVSVLF